MNRIQKRRKRIFLAHLHLVKKKREKGIFSSRFKSLTIVKLVLIASIFDVSYLAKFREQNSKEKEENFSYASPLKKKKRKK